MDREQTPEGGTPTRPVPPPQGGYGYPPPQPQGQGYPPQGYPPQGYPPPGYPPQGGYPPPPYPPAPAKKGGLPGWFWVIIGLVGACALIAIIGFFFFGSWFANVLGKPVETVTRFYTALDAGRCAEARSLLTAEMQSVDYCARWNELKASGTTTVGGVDGGISVNNGISRVDWSLLAGGERHRPVIMLREFDGQMKIFDSTPDLLPRP